MRLLLAALSLLQHPGAERPDVRAGLDTLYGGGFPAAAAYFADLADTGQPVVAADPGSPAAQALEAVARRVSDALAALPR